MLCRKHPGHPGLAKRLSAALHPDVCGGQCAEQRSAVLGAGLRREAGRGLRRSCLEAFALALT